MSINNGFPGFGILSGKMEVQYGDIIRVTFLF
jgi:hypothetical protein